MKKFALIKEDLVQGFGNQESWPKVPDDLIIHSITSLRFDGVKVINTNKIKNWLIDGSGLKRLPSMHPDKDWQAINCNFDDELIKESGVWRVKTDEDRQVEAKDIAKNAVRIQIDTFKDQLLGKYTDTEQQGWSVLLPQAQKFIETGEEADAPSIVLRAAGDIRKRKPKELAQGIVFASKITALLPDLASVIRSNANYMIDETDGSAEAIKSVTDFLKAKQAAIGVAIQSGDQQAVFAAAATGWEV